MAFSFNGMRLDPDCPLGKDRQSGRRIVRNCGKRTMPEKRPDRPRFKMVPVHNSPAYPRRISTEENSVEKELTRDWFEAFPQAAEALSRNYLFLKEYSIHIDSQPFLDLFPPGGLPRWARSRFCKTGNTCYSQTHRIIKPLRG
ncbi:MAG: hypothetical protein KAH44_26140, partial [Oricola sp.]|nr:hypothetical protein [Oricola sp.]